MLDRSKQLQKILESFYKIKRHADLKNMCRTYGLSVTHSQWIMLSYIYREGSVSVKEICTEFGITSSAVTQLITELVKHHYVIKVISTTDRRMTNIHLTPKTKQVILRVRRAILAHMLKMFSVLDDKEFTKYMQLSMKIHDRIN